MSLLAGLAQTRASLTNPHLLRVQSKLSVLVDRAQHLSTLGDKHEKVLQALLRRICMNGFIPWNALVPLFDALHNQASNVKATRALHYLIGVILSCGSAGAPPCMHADPLHATAALTLPNAARATS